MERSGIRERSREWDDTWTDRGGAADDADGATGEERTSGGGGGGEGEDGRGRRGHTFFCGRVEGKSKCAHHMANGHCSRRRRAAERTPRSPSQPRGSDRKIAEKRIKGGDDIGTNAVRFIRRRNRYTPFV